MNYFEVTGYYTYRSFLNTPDPVGDFNKIAFAEGELFLYVTPDGKVTGTLAFPDNAPDTTAVMDISGRVIDWQRGAIELEGVGRSGTTTDSFDYKYAGSFAPTFAEAVAERRAIDGTVLRAKPHGTAKPGVTASFVAVKRDYPRPRTIPQVALIPEAIAMLASRRHRLQHNVWHTVRRYWLTLNKDEKARTGIDNRGWWPKRPPFRDNGALDLENGAGEDFLYMHRRMIEMVRAMYAAAGKTPPKAWTSLPAPDAPQLVYKASADGNTFTIDPDTSGFMVPPPLADVPSDVLVKSATFLTGTMRPLQALFQSPRWMSIVTLGQLGNLIEWSIHGWMHNRWGDTIVDETGQPVGRSSLFDIDPKWDAPENDDLLDFYSSQVHPTFWRLHGWIDDRIEAWAAVHPEVQRKTVDGVSWFAADGKTVLADSPFSWPAAGHHHAHQHSHQHDDQDIKVMEEVMEIMRNVVEPTAPQGAAVARTKLARDAIREHVLGIAMRELLR